MFIPEASIKNPVMATMIVAAMVVLGMFAYPRVGVDMEPDVDFPFVVISTTLVGASPETIELKVTKQIEDAVSTISGIKTITSSSYESFSQVLCEFELKVDSDVAAQDVRDKVAQVENELPSGTETPIIAKFDPNAEAIMLLSMSAPASIKDITKIAKDIVKPELQTLQGVGDVTVIGGRERQVRIWLDAESLVSYGVTPSEVVQALQLQNIEYPGGRIEQPLREFIVKTSGELPTVQAFSDLVVTYRDNSPIKLGDLARVEDGLAELRSLSKLDGVTALGLSLRKQSDANALRVAQRVNKQVERLNDPETRLLPKGYRIEVSKDNTTFVEESFNDVMHHIVYGGILALLIVLLFLRNFRSTFIAAMALPSSIIGSFLFLDMFGFTFNMMTLLALSISVGMLVDDAIVVIENVYRHLEMGKSPMKAAKDGTNEIAFAVIVTTMAILAVFVPVAFMEGIVGQYFFEFGITVSVAVALSLLVSLVLTPMMASRLLKKQKEPYIARMLEKVFRAIERVYEKLIHAALSSVFSKSVVIAAALTAFLAAGYLTTQVKSEFFPTMDRGEIDVAVKAPLGSTIQKTQKILDKVDRYIHENVPELQLTVMSIGGGQSGSVHEGTLFVKLTRRTERERSQDDITKEIREFVSGIPDIEYSVRRSGGVAGNQSGMRAGDIEYQFRGEDIDLLNRYAVELQHRLQDVEGFVDVRVTYDPSKPEVRVYIDRQRAAAYNVPVAAIGRAIQISIGGVEATQYREVGDQYEVWVRFKEPMRDRPFDIYNVPIRSASGELVRLHNLVRVEQTSGPVLIERQARQRQVTVVSNLDTEKIVLGRAKEVITQQVAEMNVSPEVKKAFTGIADIQDESNQNILMSLILAVLVIYMLLASQFNSFIHPLTIMLSVVLAFVGAIGGLIVVDQSLNIISQIGIIMLMGIVTKNAILLVDFTNQLRDRGTKRDEALAKAGSIRLRPILMTTLATMFGMLPIALGLGEGAEMRQPMATVVIGGLTTSTLLTLVVIPVVYSVFDALKKLVGVLLVIVGALVLGGLAYMSFFAS